MGTTNAAPKTDGLSAVLDLFLRKCIVWLAPHSISICLEPRNANLLQSKTLNTKSRQGTGKQTFARHLKPGNNFASLLFSSQKDQPFWSLASRSSRPDPQFRSAWKRRSFRSGPIPSSFLCRVFRHRGARSSPTSRFGPNAC